MLTHNDRVFFCVLMCALSRLLIPLVMYDVCWEFATIFPIKYSYLIKFGLLENYAMLILMPLDFKDLFLKPFLRT